MRAKQGRYTYARQQEAKTYVNTSQGLYHAAKGLVLWSLLVAEHLKISYIIRYTTPRDRYSYSSTPAIGGRGLDRFFFF